VVLDKAKESAIFVGVPEIEQVVGAEAEPALQELKS
jgi:hypothetical protein